MKKGKGQKLFHSIVDDPDVSPAEEKLIYSECFHVVKPQHHLYLPVRSPILKVLIFV